ncbi:MAG TPA: PH domain-containing protein [Clostridiales bacterium]|nr:PH domain-containing protein [Clostridiales bacterium]
MIYQHPYKILQYSARNLWLLIFPLLRGFVAIKLDINELYLWLKGAWFDILIILAILTMGYIRWRCSYFTIEEDSIIYRKGVFLRTKTDIPFSKISTVSSERRLLYLFIQAADVIIDTNGAGHSKADMKLLVKYSDLNEMEEKITVMKKKEGMKYTYKPNWWTMVFFSVVFSSSFSGAIYIATAFFQTGKIIEEIINRKLTDTLSDVTNEVATELVPRIPPIAIGIALLVLLSWFLSFARNVFRYVRFKIEKDKSSVKINMGIIKKYVYYLALKKVNYVDLRQNLVMKLFNVMSVNISCSGYGNEKNEIPVFVPIMQRNQVQNALKIFAGDIKLHKSMLKPRKTTAFRYSWVPLLFAVLVFMAGQLMLNLYPSLTEIIRFVLFMAEIPLVWLFIVKLVSVFTSGFSIEDDQLCICYCRMFAYHTIMAKKDKISKIKIRQSIWQRYFKKCDVIFYLNSKTSKGHIIKALSLSDVEKVLEFRYIKPEIVLDEQRH